jgi:pimeloyl-ACP methyl ester carboxylesterase
MKNNQRAAFQTSLLFAVRGEHLRTCHSTISLAKDPMTSTQLLRTCALATFLTLGWPVLAQVRTIVPEVVSSAKPVSVERIKIHGTALEGNLEGDAVDRDVIVFLPPSYQQEKKRRYPVVYALHGYSIGADQWTHEIHAPQTIEGAFALGSQEMIIVLPDSKTIYNGSMYSSSQTTGDFERFIYRDVVAYIDAHYRTINDRKSRGLVGHSMGGYGASRIGMKHPDVFGALYIMSPCCLSPIAGGGPGPSEQIKERALASEKKVNSAKSPADLAASSPGFGSVQYASAAHGRLTRRTHLCISTSLRKTVFRSQKSLRSSLQTRRLPSLINTSKTSSSIALFLWMWATRMVCASMPSSCIRFWTTTELQTNLRSTPERTPVQLPIDFKIMSCHFSPRISALREIAARCLIRLNPLWRN